MISHLNLHKKFDTLQIFKIATIIHFICIIIKIIALPYVAKENLIITLTTKIASITILLICGIVAIKSIQAFSHHHQYFIRHYKFAALVVESCIAAIIFGIIFLNKKIMNAFITFLADLSKKTQNHSIMILLLLFLLVYAMKLYHAWTLNTSAINEISMKETVNVNLTTLLLKLGIIFGTIIGFLHPIMNILTVDQVQQFDTIILSCTTKEFFLYMRMIIILLLGLWTIAGIYWMYTFYNKKRR